MQALEESYTGTIEEHREIAKEASKDKKLIETLDQLVYAGEGLCEYPEGFNGGLATDISNFKDKIPLEECKVPTYIVHGK